MSKERPILMNGAMVRATLAGTKSQTRRVVKNGIASGRSEAFQKTQAFQDDLAPACPYGQPGDRLWVRETWRTDATLDDRAPSDFAGWPVKYEADGAVLGHGAHFGNTDGKTRPAIFMPRAASRIQLRIISVRVERLNDCSEADAKAEGVMQLDADVNPRPETRTKDDWQICPTCGGTGLRSTLGAGGGVNFDVDCTDCDTHLKLYRHLWEAINGAGSWDANPWVWCVEFARVTP